MQTLEHNGHGCHPSWGPRDPSQVNSPSLSPFSLSLPLLLRFGPLSGLPSVAAGHDGARPCPLPALPLPSPHVPKF